MAAFASLIVFINRSRMPRKTAKRKSTARSLRSGEVARLPCLQGPGPDDDDEDGSVTADEQPRKKTRGSTALNGAELRDNKHVQSWVELQTSFIEKDKEDRRQFADDFKKNREKHRKTIGALFKKAAESIHVAGKEYANLSGEACVGIAPPMSPKSKGSCHQDQPMFKTGRTLIQSCRNIIRIHEQANDKTTTQCNNHSGEKRILWDKDIAQIEKVLLYSAQLGEKLIACNFQLAAAGEEKKKQLLIPPHNVLKGEGYIAVEIQRRATDILLNGASTWGEEALSYLEKFVDLAAPCGTKLGNA